jgi:carboxyl-terminal processing protease
VRIGASGPDLASHFAGALGHMPGTRALIVDLRDVAGPGLRETTLAILARFARQPGAWQVRQGGGRREMDMVRPEGTPYTAPVAVLVDRWTAGEAEALAAGLESVARATLVGTPMAGLRGELREAALPLSGMALRFPAQRTFSATSGAPRESIRPSVAVDLAAPSGGPGDPILYQALKLFDRR